MKDRNIILVGFMGTGKSTVGKSLANRLGWSFVDTDQRIEALIGGSISEYFSAKGEAAFRRLETETLLTILQRSGQVVSTGGGAVLSEANREHMTASGLVVALKADYPVLLERLKSDTSRPLLAGDAEANIRRLLDVRRNAYDFAHLSVDTGQASIEQTVCTIVRHMEFET